MNKRKIMGSVIANALVLNLMLSGISVKAVPLNSNNNENQVKNLENQIELNDNEIQNTMVEIYKNNKDISKITKDIEITNEKLNLQEEKLKSDELNSKSAAKAVYESGGDTTIVLNTLLESKDFIDLINKTTFISNVLKSNKNIMKNARDERKSTENIRNKLLKKKAEGEKLLNDNKNKLNKLNEDKTKEKEELVKLNSYVNNSTPVNVYNQCISTGHLMYDDNNIVNYAKNFLGIPYVWGGTSPSGFDCSGFVGYVYAHFGINLPRTTYEQVNVGTTVNGTLQPGDLVFFGDINKPHHVGMYIGNGEYIQAPHTGDYVKISAIDGSGYSIAKRILK